MTVEKLELLSDNKIKASSSKNGHKVKKEHKGADTLNTLVTAALHKHASRKLKKKDNTAKKEAPEEKELETISSHDTKNVESQSEKIESSAIESTGGILGITVHGCDRLEASPVIFPHPVVQVHICDSDSGTWLQKSSKDRKVTSYYEGSNVDYILPIMTQPYDLKKNRSLCCQWQEQLVFNESLEHFTTEKPQVIVFFQLMDFPSSSTGSGIHGNQSQNPSTQGWVTLAWAFLKIRGGNNHHNVGNRLRLQLWRPRKSTGVNLTDLYSWWKSGNRNKYKSTMNVSLHEIVIPQNPHPALRSMLVTQKEYGGEAPAEKLLSNLSVADSSQSPSANIQGSHVTWGRKPNQSCRVPNFVKHCLPHAEEGCMVVKFSHNGMRLACGARKQILIYEVISGKLEYVFSGHLGLIYDLCWSDSDRLLLSASGDSTVRVWDIEPSEICGNSQMLTHPSHVYTARFVPQKPQIFVSGGYDHVIRVWLCGASGSYSVLQELTNHLAFVNALCFSHEGDTLYSGDKQGVILVWNVKVPKKGFGRRRVTILSLQQEVKIADVLGKVINFISYHSGGFRLLVHTRDSQVKLVNHKYWTVTHRLIGILNVREQLRGCMSPCGTWVISGSEDHGVYAWHSDSGELTTAFLNLPIKGTTSCVDFHPHDNMLAISSYASQTPILVLGYSPDKSQGSGTLANSVPPDKPFGLSSLLTRSQSLSHIDSESSESPTAMDIAENEQALTKMSSFMSFTRHQMTTVRTTLVDSQEHSPDGKQMWEDVGNRILSNLDNILKMASEDPLSMNKHNISEETDEKEKLQVLGRLASVLYDFEATEPDELSVKQGDFVIIVKSDNKDWWHVKTANMKSMGLVPATYLQPLPAQHQPDTTDSGKVIAIHSGSGEVSFISDTEGTPSKARTRRHKAKADSSQSGFLTSTPKNKG